MPTKKRTSKKVRSAAASSSLKEVCLGVFRSVKLHAQREVGCEPEIYAAIAGLKAPPESQFLASEVKPIVRAAAAVLQELEKKAKKGTADFFRATVSLPIYTTIDCVRLDVVQLRKLRNDLKKAGIKNAVGMVLLRAWPADNPFKCRIYAVIELIVYGQILESTSFDAARERMEKKAEFEGAAITFERIEPARPSLQAAVTEVFDLSEGDEGALRVHAKELGVKGWSKRKPLRDFCRFIALASVPFKGMTFAVGDGQRLIDKAIVDGKSTIEHLVERQAQIIHRDAIARFIAAELVRLRMTSFRLPFIRYR
jgi:hypothetical protein